MRVHEVLSLGSTRQWVFCLHINEYSAFNQHQQQCTICCFDTDLIFIYFFIKSSVFFLESPFSFSAEICRNRNSPLRSQPVHLITLHRPCHAFWNFQPLKENPISECAKLIMDSGQPRSVRQHFRAEQKDSFRSCTKLNGCDSPDLQHSHLRLAEAAKPTAPNYTSASSPHRLFLQKLKSDLSSFSRVVSINNKRSHCTLILIIVQVFYQIWESTEEATRVITHCSFLSSDGVWLWSVFGIPSSLMKWIFGPQLRAKWNDLGLQHEAASLAAGETLSAPSLTVVQFTHIAKSRHTVAEALSHFQLFSAASTGIPYSTYCKHTRWVLWIHSQGIKVLVSVFQSLNSCVTPVTATRGC